MMTGIDRIDEIRREVVLDAPVDRVWKAVTSPEEVSQWFGDVTEIDLQPGGKAKFGWTEYDDVFEAVVTEVEEPSRFAYSWAFKANTP